MWVWAVVGGYVCVPVYVGAEAGAWVVVWVCGGWVCVWVGGGVRGGGGAWASEW